MAFTQPDSKDVSIAGNGPGSLLANSTCLIKDIIAGAFQLNNVSSANQGFIPTINDNVNTGNYTVWNTVYDVGSSVIRGWYYMICNNAVAATPTVALSSSAIYLGGSLSYIRFTGASNTPVIDPSSQLVSGTSSPVVGSISAQGGASGVGELLIVLPQAGSLPGSSPSPWVDIFNATGAYIAQPAFAKITSPQSVGYSKAQNTSGVWWAAFLGFNDGAFPAGGVSRQHLMRLGVR